MLDPKGPAAPTAAVFAMLAGPSRSWAREFVLAGWDGDPAGDCAALCNPLALRCGETNECMSYMPSPRTRAAPEVCVPYAPQSASFSRYQMSSVWIPSWTHDGVTVGMAVHTCEKKPGAEEHDSDGGNESARAELSIGRFARDESSGEMLIVLKDAPVSELGKRVKVAVKHTRYIGAHGAQVTWLVCDNATMIRQRSRAPEAMFSAACIYSNVTKAERADAVCGLTQSAAGCCDCLHRRAVPVSPTDYSRFRANGVYGYGRWAGASTIQYVGSRGGFGPSRSSTIFSMTACPDGVRALVGDRLQALAIQERMISGAFCKPSPVPAGVIEPAPPATMAGGEQPAGDAADPPPLAFNVEDFLAVEGAGLEEVAFSAELAPAAGMRPDDDGGCDESRAGDAELYPTAAAAAVPPPSDSLTDAQLAKKRRRQESSRLAAARSKARQREYAAKLAQDLASIQARLLEMQKRYASALAVNAALKEVTQPRGSRA